MHPADLVMNSDLLWPMALTLAVCALIGLEFHRYQREEDESLAFGTVRTLPMIGLPRKLERPMPKIASARPHTTWFARSVIAKKPWIRAKTPPTPREVRIPRRRLWE